MVESNTELGKAMYACFAGLAQLEQRYQCYEKFFNSVWDHFIGARSLALEMDEFEACATRAGFARVVPYDPRRHGPHEFAEEGSAWVERIDKDPVPL